MNSDAQPDLTSFLRAAAAARREGRRVVPVYQRLDADLDTPVGAFLKVGGGPYSFLFESVEGQERISRYSFVGADPRWIWELRGETIRILTPAGRVLEEERATDPLRQLERRFAGYRAAPVPGLPRFTGGLVGYAGYDLARCIEPRVPASRCSDVALPSMCFMLVDTLLIFDQVEHQLILVANAIIEGKRSDRACYAEALTRLDTLRRLLAAPLPRQLAPHRAASAVSTGSNMTKAQFASMIARAKEYIRAGDIIQVVLSQRFERPLRRTTPLQVYRKLRQINPSPYMFYLSTGEAQLIGSSPEMLVRCEGDQLETRPIAGTRRRGASEQEDQKLIEQLLASPKERAEHVMLVDLGRNDLGRVSATGSVKTPASMIVEKYSHVIHLVSSVTGKLARGKTAFDVLRATFPAGTVSGAPKVRAMEIIAELEPTARGPYAGAVGYFDFAGNMDVCITIRTILVHCGTAYVQAGAGIVADSQAAREYDETRNKARGMLQAIDLAESG